MCKQLKRLILLADCPHLNKTDRDALQWAIQNLSPEQAETETSFDGWDFQAWPSVPDKRVFNDLIKARKAKNKVIMLQAYIDNAAPHLHELSLAGVTVNDSLMPAIIGGWTSFKASWVLTEIAKAEVASKVEINGIEGVLPAIKSGQLTNISQLKTEYIKMIESDYRFGKYKPETMALLEGIGFVI